MAKEPYLEAGKIINSFGVRGEGKLDPWCDSAEFLKPLKTLYIDGAPRAVRREQRKLQLRLRGQIFIIDQVVDRLAVDGQQRLPRPHPGARGGRARVHARDPLLLACIFYHMPAVYQRAAQKSKRGAAGDALRLPLCDRANMRQRTARGGRPAQNPAAERAIRRRSAF